MYIIRFSYDFLPVHRTQVIDLIRREVEGARAQGLHARLLVPRHALPAAHRYTTKLSLTGSISLMTSAAPESARQKKLAIGCVS